MAQGNRDGKRPNEKKKKEYFTQVAITNIKDYIKRE